MRTGNEATPDRAIARPGVGEEGWISVRPGPG